MAEILLGRLTGPSGFERSVVIKRILPAYAEERQFVEMFLDEARIAARIHHPNVVQHQELGEDGEQLYLVMEYLDGESLASVQRRARSRDDRLSYAEAVHVIASAAAGLHAAHEMTDHEGEALGIVHRDISPQNLFVTYRGGVKVMDFGIAKASDRITTTEAGSLKGKIRYMSPEQARGEALDRRSDLFSLAIVLYELTTGHALFRRNTPLASLRAVQDDPIPPPSSIVADYPPTLEAVCLRALARDPGDRYPDVHAFRIALLDALPALAGGGRPEEELAAHMERLFADRMDEKREMLRRVSHGTELHTPPEPEVDTHVEIPSVVVEASTEEPSTAPEVVAPSSSRRPAALGALGVALALGVGVAGYALSREDESVSSTPLAPIESTPGETAESATEPPEPAVEDVEDDAAPVQVTIESEPPGAMVRLAGDEVGPTPATVPIARGTEAVSIELSLDGYRPLVTEVVPDLDQRLRLSLQRQPRRRSRPPRTPAMEAEMAAETTAFPRFN